MIGVVEAPSGSDSADQLLHELPRGDVLRNRPLGQIAAQCRNRHGKEWRDVARWRIASASYDELGESWTSTSEFRVRQA
ncbi:MAG: hypothetical protein E6Q93_28440 [Burkholderiaceae bacterium]|nr:MAG: hypothetical protein E6Q93_28440 [Burkholderiaceae bacterium]